MTEYPWEPPLAGTEVEHLAGALVERSRARHTGHADLLREAIDGLTGEDPRAAGVRNPASTTSAADRPSAASTTQP